jgi:hypothetical protein
MKKLVLLALVGAVLLTTAPVLADDGFYVVAVGGAVGTRIGSLPYEIKTPGFYYLTGSISYNAGNGITVSADDVTIDLMGFRLSSIGAFEGIAIGSHKNVEVRNGSLYHWGSAINAGSNSANIRIINVRAEGNGTGIGLTGFSHLIKGCTISDNNFNGIFLNGAATISGNVINHNGTYGIFAAGGYAMITGNMVSNADTHIYLNGPGNIIGNTIKTDGGQLAIDLSQAGTNQILLDQNVVGGPGSNIIVPMPNKIVYGTNAGFGT